MLSSFIITFREALEAALVVGIVLSYLHRTGQTRHNKVVYLSVISGIVASIIGAILFNTLANGFTGTAEKLFEGITMLIGAFLLTTMILWMMHQKNVALELENKVEHELSKTYQLGLFLLVFFAILREGIETVIFLAAASFVSSGNTLIGAVAGLAGAIMLAYGLFVMTMKVNIKRFFNVTSVLLILFAAGLVAHGVHELQEAGVLPIIIEHIWDINPAKPSELAYPALHEKGFIGSILKSLFGYNGNPSLLEVIAYVTYLAMIFRIWKKSEQKNETKTGSLVLNAG
jgi:high-affinity iron transporter